MRALVRYNAAEVLRGQRWLAPLLAYAALLAVVDATNGSLRSTYAASAVLLVPIACWVTVVVNQSEDPAQTAITVTNAGSRTRVWLAKLVTAAAGCMVLVLAALVAPAFARSAGWTATTFGLGVAAFLACAAFGVALGAVCSPPVVRCPAWAVLAAVSLSLLDVVIPGAPPSRQVLSQLGSEPPRHLTLPVLLTLIETIAVSTVLIVAATWLANRRD